MNQEYAIFGRTELLLGQRVMESMAQVRVILFGIGGVGSWCAEALVRSGIHNLTLVDYDSISYSNINRQLPATFATVGQKKVEAIKARLKEINPKACIDVRHEMFCQESANAFQLNTYDYIIDAIDTLKDKATLINLACFTEATLFSSMGAALKTDPFKIQTAEFNNVKVCPLARALRHYFKQNDQWPAKKFTCVYSEEVSKSCSTSSHVGSKFDEGGGKGSVVYITAIFGFILAWLVIRHIQEKNSA